MASVITLICILSVLPVGKGMCCKKVLLITYTYLYLLSASSGEGHTSRDHFFSLFFFGLQTFINCGAAY